MPTSPHASTGRSRRNLREEPLGRRARGRLDPFDVLASGEDTLRFRLTELSVEELKDVVAEHGMDHTRLAMRWRRPERLIDLIVSETKSRLAKGDAFRPD